MAYVESQLDEDEEKKRLTGTPVLTTEGEGGTLNAGAVTGPGGQLAGPNRVGSGFPDIRAYLDKNQEQSLGLAGTIGSRLGEESTKTKSDITEAGSAFGGDVTRGTVKYDPNIVETSLSNPSEAVKSPVNLEAFQTQRRGEYAGPTSFTGTEEYANLEGQVSEGERKKGLVESESGRNELLFGIQKKPTEGKVRLDQLLLGANPQSIASLRSSAEPFGQLRDYLSQTSQTAEEGVTKGIEESESTRNLVHDKLFGEEGAIPTFESDLNTRLASTRTAAEERASAIPTALKNLTDQSLSEEQLADLGITREQEALLRFPQWVLKSNYPTGGGMSTPEDIALNQALIDLMGNVTRDPSQYARLSGSPETISRETFASPEDYTEYLSLAELAGIDPTLLRESDRNLAGTANLDLTDFDYGGAKTALDESARTADQAIIDYLESFQTAGAPISRKIGDYYVPWPSNYSGTLDQKNELGVKGAEAMRRLEQGYDVEQYLPFDQATPSPTITPPSNNVSTEKPEKTSTPPSYSPPDFIESIQQMHPDWRYIGNNNWETPNGTVHISG